MQYRFLTGPVLSSGGAFWLVAVAAFAYLLGSISFSIIFTKKFRNVDVRDVGSGNAGTTNALRAGGVKIAVATLVCDILKGTIAVIIGGLFGGGTGMLLSAVMVLIGHCYPVFFGFKGGKAVATTIGIFAILDIRIILLSLVVFFAAAIITRFVSLGSVLMAITLVVLSIIFGYDVGFIAAAAFSAFIVIIRHYENIVRLFKGQEKKISFKKQK